MKIQPKILILLACLPLLLFGQGKYAGELFEIPGDAKSLAMGGAGVSLLHGAATGFYNPALAGQVGEASLLMAHREQFAGMVQADLVAVSFKPGGPLAIQVGILRRGIDDIPDTRDALDDRNGDGKMDEDEYLIPDRIRYFNQREWGLLLTVSKTNQTGWVWGVNAKLLGNWLADGLGLGLGFDLGIWRQLTSWLAIGLMAQDVTTTQVYWNTGTWQTTMPRLTAGSTIALPMPLSGRKLRLTGALTSRLDGERMERDVQLGPISVLSNVGVELPLNNNLRLRVGRSTIFPLTAGFGFDFPIFEVDYAYISDTGARVFEPTHQVSLSLKLETLANFLGLGQQ